MSHTFPALAIAVAACILWSVPAKAQTATTGSPGTGTAAAASAMAPAVDDSLYRALGEQAGINRLVADFVPRLATDPRLSEFFKKAHLDHLRQMLALQFCAVAGGPCTYTGKTMKEAHTDMDISKADFNALVELLQVSMDAQGIPFSTQNQLLARLAPMHRDVINVH